MRSLFLWLADRLRPWHDTGLPEELRFPQIPVEGFQRGAMRRAAHFASGPSGFPSGVFELIGMEYAERAVRAWRPHELHLMEDVSLAWYLVEHQRKRGVIVEREHVERLVITLVNYFECVGETRTREEVEALVNGYLAENSAPDAEPLMDWRNVRVVHPLLDQLRETDKEIAAKFPCRYSEGSAGLGDVGLHLSRLDAARYDWCTPRNCRTFASTGGEGVHFSLLVQDGAITESSPVVMTTPSAGGGSLIVGENLFDFLCLGSPWGYFMLEELAYDTEGTQIRGQRDRNSLPTGVASMI